MHSFLSGTGITMLYILIAVGVVLTVMGVAMIILNYWVK